MAAVPEMITITKRTTFLLKAYSEMIYGDGSVSLEYCPAIADIQHSFGYEETQIHHSTLRILVTAHVPKCGIKCPLFQVYKIYLDSDKYHQEPKINPKMLDVQSQLEGCVMNVLCSEREASIYQGHTNIRKTGACPACLEKYQGGQPCGFEPCYENISSCSPDELAERIAWLHVDDLLASNEEVLRQEVLVASGYTGQPGDHNYPHENIYRTCSESPHENCACITCESGQPAGIPTREELDREIDDYMGVRSDNSPDEELVHNMPPINYWLDHELDAYIQRHE